MPTINTVFSRAPARPIPHRRARLRGVLVGAIALLALATATLEADAAVPAHGRAWELVTPPNPNGAMIGAISAVVPTGDRLGFMTIGSLPGSEGGSLTTLNFAKRTASGWDSVPLMPAYSNAVMGLTAPPLAHAANSDLSTWLWGSTRPFTPDGPVSPAIGLYSRETYGKTTLVANVGASEITVAGTSADARRLVFRTQAKLLPEDVRPSGSSQVYEATAAGLRLVGVDDGGVPLSNCGAIAGSERFSPNPVSRDARRIFVTSPFSTCGTSRKRVYLRENGATTEVSASRCTRSDCNSAADVKFMGATPSGSVAFVATSQQLTDDDLDTGQDLYRYDVAGGTLSRVSAGPPGVVAAVVPSAAYSSDDGSRAYFVATGALVPGKGTAGMPNVYMSDDQGLHFVATIAPSEPWVSMTVPLAGETFALRQEIQLTPEGHRLLIRSRLALTPDDVDSMQDAYLYDAEDDTLTRISGTAGSGNGAFDVDVAQSPTPGLYAVRPVAGHPAHSLSDDGRHVFFRTDEALTPDDDNTTIDVYEWRDGVLGLVTSGAPSGSVRYDTASADGSSVFFTTDESLTPDDDDNGDPDLYVARQGGGFPVDAPPGGCTGDGCSPKPDVRLSRPVPASVDFVDDSAGRFDVLPVSPAARRRMASSGWLKLSVETGAPGRVVARAVARVGRRKRTVARGVANAGRAGTVRLRLRLSSVARRRLRDGHTLVIRVKLHRSKPNRASAVLLRLEPRR
jgi:hypothetical protein